MGKQCSIGYVVVGSRAPDPSTSELKFGYTKVLAAIWGLVPAYQSYHPSLL